MAVGGNLLPHLHRHVQEGKLLRVITTIYTGSTELRALEAISHPLIGAEIARRVEAAGDGDVVLELPLASNLAVSGWTRIVVAAPEEVRLQRAVARGMERADVLRRIDVQPGDDEWSTGATVVIANTGTIAEFEQEVRRVWAELKAAR